MTGAQVRLRLDLSYDGTAYAGWARQPDLPTVQAVVEEALAAVLRLTAAPSLVVAGRTDAGVHARAQVAHVDVPPDVAHVVETGTGAQLRRFAAVLPADVRLRRLQTAPPGFDARFSAVSRVYAYRVTDAVTGPDPLRRADTMAHPRPLDRALLQAASDGLVGEHDFAAYCRRRDGATTIRRLLRLHWDGAGDRDGAGDGAGDAGGDGVLVATVEADAFCHSMVRGLVGALLLAGDGRRPPSWPAGLLGATGRDSSVPVAPPHGLTLVAVRYPPDDLLAARAVVTRRLRTPSAMA